MPDYLWFVQHINHGIADLSIVAGAQEMIEECAMILKDQIKSSYMIQPFVWQIVIYQFFSSTIQNSFTIK